MSHHTDFSPQNFQGQQKHRQPDRVLILNLSSVLSTKVTRAAMGSPKSEVRNHRLRGGIFPKTQVSHPGKKGGRVNRARNHVVKPASPGWGTVLGGGVRG